MFSIANAVHLYGLMMIALFALIVVVLFIAVNILSAIKDLSFALLGGGRVSGSEDQDRPECKSGEHDDIIQSLDGMSDQDAKRYLESKREDLENERQELAHLRLPTSFDSGFGYDAYRHQGLSQLRYVESRISSIDHILASK